MLSERCLKQSAAHLFNATLSAVIRQGDELDREVKSQTLGRKKGLSAGLKWTMCQKGRIASRRFGVQQGQKIRLIDDCSASYINSTVTVNESPK